VGVMVDVGVTVGVAVEVAGGTGVGVFVSYGVGDGLDMASWAIYRLVGRGVGLRGALRWHAASIPTPRRRMSPR
jgi:hypothetical protein